MSAGCHPEASGMFRRRISSRFFAKAFLLLRMTLGRERAAIQASSRCSRLPRTFAARAMAVGSVTAAVSTCCRPRVHIAIAGLDCDMYHSVQSSRIRIGLDFTGQCCPEAMPISDQSRQALVSLVRE